MDNPYKPPVTPTGDEPFLPPSNAAADVLAEPVLAYTANGNLEANSVVTLWTTMCSKSSTRTNSL